MHLKITLVFKDSLWCMGILSQLIHTRNGAEEFCHKDLAVFTFHEFFISIVLIKNRVWALLEWASVPFFAFMFLGCHMKTIQTATLLFFK